MAETVTFTTVASLVFRRRFPRFPVVRKEHPCDGYVRIVGVKVLSKISRP